MTNYSFNRESLKRVLLNEREDLEKLVKENSEEGEKYLGATFGINVDWDKFLLLEELGILGVFGVRYESKLVGYCLILADNDLHHKDKIFANVDTIFISKEYRRGGVGHRFVIYLMEQMRTLNVSMLSISAKVGHSFNKLLKKLDFMESEVVHFINLENG